MLRDKINLVTRRNFLKNSGLIVAGLSAGVSIAEAHQPGTAPKLRFGLVTDPHYAAADTRGTRHYRESVAKMTECVEFMNKENVDFLIELGDFKDQDEPGVEEATLTYLDTIEFTYSQFNGPTYHVLGNHDTDSLSKEQFLSGIENTGIPADQSYYSFNSNGIQIIVLDGNYKADGSSYDHGNFEWTDTNIPKEEVDWLARVLASNELPALVFIHQLLDGEGNLYVNNAAEIRSILQDSGKVLAVFQGHHHEGQYNHLGEIHYYTLKAMVEGSGVENNSYAIVEVDAEHNISVNGFRRADSMNLPKL